MKKTNITRTITSLLVAAAMLGVTSCGQSDNHQPLQKRQPLLLVKL